jgi:hypothetical protein
LVQEAVPPAVGPLARAKDGGETAKSYDSPNWDAGASGFRGTNERVYHDHVHVLVGGDVGDMTDPDLACNDPSSFSITR